MIIIVIGDVGGTTLGINPRGNIMGVYNDAAGDHGFIGMKVD